MNDRIRELEVQLAYSAARSDIETMCPSVNSDGSEPANLEEFQACWYNTDRVFIAEDWPSVTIALEYLDLRGLIERCDGKPNWVRVKTEGWAMANTIECEEFHKLMNEYRLSMISGGTSPNDAFQAVIDYIDKDRAGRDRRIVAATVKACANECEREKMFEGGRQMSYAHHGVSGAAKAISAITPESVLADIDKQDKGQS